MDALRSIFPRKVRSLIKNITGISALQERLAKAEDCINHFKIHTLQLEERISILEECQVSHMTDGSNAGPKFHFLDIGTKVGESIKFAGEAYNMPLAAGIGIDLEENVLATARENGFAVMKMNALNLGFKDKSFRFALMLQLLEHLNSMEEVGQAIAEACRVSRNFILLITPNFEYTQYLKAFGMKFSWSDWIGHPTHITETGLRDCLKQLRISNFVIEKTNPIRDSTFEQIIPASAPTDTIVYDREKHGRKKYVRFDPPLYSELRCTIYLGNS